MPPANIQRPYARHKGYDFTQSKGHEEGQVYSQTGKVLLNNNFSNQFIWQGDGNPPHIHIAHPVNIYQTELVRKDLEI